MGGQAAAHPADLRVVYLRGGNHTVKTLAMLVLPPGFLPAVSLRLGELTVGPARDQKSHTQFPVPRVEQNSILFRELELVSLGVRNEHVSGTLLLKNSIKKKKKSPSDKLSGPGCAVLWSKYSLASTE